MIYLSKLVPFPVEANNNDPFVASENTRKIREILTNPDADDFDIMVDVGGIIYLAPFDGVSELNGIIPSNQPPFLRNTANWCLTFQYGSSFATRPGSANMSFRNFQIEADEKAFLFETNINETNINVTIPKLFSRPY